MNNQLTLFPLPENNLEPLSHEIKSKPRLVRACRDQYEMSPGTLDDLLPKDHLVRDIWRYVEKLDLSITLNKINAVEGNVGRPAIDPKILLALWLYATIKSINSARLIEEYCRDHNAFKWICGGVNINYHTISDFRSDHGDQLNDLLIQSVAILSKIGVISLEKVCQDGLRVRANAGSSSFRRGATLKDHIILATELLKDLNEEAKTDPSKCKQRIEAAERRAAKEKIEKLESAQNELKELIEDKIKKAKKERKKIKEQDIANTRASTTDPDARIMKMACNGFRPAYNVQFASTNVGKAIISVDVIKQGSDSGQAVHMIRLVEKMYGMVPKSWAVDAGYKSHEQIDLVEKEYRDCKIYMPVESKGDKDPYKKRPNDSKAVGDWRERMGSAEAKEQYKERAATAEYVNAQSRNKGLQQFKVRGIDKVKCVAIMYAITHNIMIFLNS